METKDFVPTPPEGYRLIEDGERLQPGDMKWIDGPIVLLAKRGERPHWGEFWASDWGVIKNDYLGHYCRAIDESKLDAKIELFAGPTIDMAIDIPRRSLN